jgi:uncharacterized protein (TIGR03435 family)
MRGDSIFLIFAACALVFAQTTVPPPSFEVSELKLNNSGSARTQVSLANGRFVATNLLLRPLIAEAWTITPDAVIGPGWLDGVRVDIIAKAASPQTSDSELRLMVQTLLKERMKLLMHIEQRDQPAWFLTVWKGQPKLTPSDMPRNAEDGDCSVENSATGLRATCRHLTMARFAHELPEIASRETQYQPVVDKTGLQGAWDFSFSWIPIAQADKDGGTTLFQALQGQLSLHLEHSKFPLPAVVVDSMDKTPSEN